MRLLGQPSTGGRSTLRLPVHRRTAGSAVSGQVPGSGGTPSSRNAAAGAAVDRRAQHIAVAGALPKCRFGRFRPR
jgi:hypothetical protein